jgi:hypothetical protein
MNAGPVRGQTVDLRFGAEASCMYVQAGVLRKRVIFDLNAVYGILLAKYPPGSVTHNDVVIVAPAKSNLWLPLHDEYGLLVSIEN